MRDNLRNNSEWYEFWNYYNSYDAWKWWRADTNIIWAFMKDLELLFYIFRKAQRVPFRKYRSPRWHTCSTGE